MKKLFHIMMALLLVIAAAGCSQQLADRADNPQETEKTPEIVITEPLPIDKDVYLDIPGDSYAMDSESIPYAIINNSGQIINVQLIPHLERETAAGWEEIATTDVGFCGTPDAIEKRWDSGVPLSWYAGSLAPGHYRLSFQTVSNVNYTPGQMLSDEFDITAAMEEEPPAWIGPANDIDMAGLNPYWQADDLPFAVGGKARLGVYVRAERNDDGEFCFDDGQDWLVLLETSIGDYPLFPRQFVQLGVLSCTVFEDMEEVCHILITVRQGAGYRLYDCVFDQERQAFRVIPVYEAQGVNFLAVSPL